MKFLILTPGRECVDLYVNSLVDTVATLMNDGHDVNYFICAGSDLLDQRNRLAGGDRHKGPQQTPYDGDYDYMLWIDSDQAWKPWHIYQAVSHDKDIVSAAIRTTDLDWPVFRTDEDLVGGKRMKELPTDLTQIAGVGFGWLLVRKGVFEALEYPWFRRLPALDGKLGYDSEDISWCRLAREAGFEIWLDPELRVAHLKTIAI